MRLDVYLYENNFAKSRQKAKELIKNKKILVDNKIATKSNIQIINQNVQCIQDVQYVSRAAYKLEHFFKVLSFNLEGKTALDIGSSTGGFSEVLLKYGAKKVVAVDVGSNQFHESLRNNAKIELFENQDIRTFEYHQKFDLIVSDVSFISLRLILDKIAQLALKDVVLLFKPQFEVGIKAKRNKKGVVVDEKEIEKALNSFLDFAKAKGFTLITKMPAIISGKEGNKESVLYFSLGLRA